MTGYVITGFPELLARLKEMTAGLSEDTDTAVYLAAARNLADRARDYAPKGQYRAKGKKQPGRLKKAIIAKAFNRPSVLRFGPGAFAQVNLSPRYATTAPYGHIVESGRQGGKHGAFAGRRFFERAVSVLGESELEAAATKLNALLKRRYGLY